MSHFIFKAKKPSGEIYSGDKDAADRYELYKLIHESGDEVVEFKEKNRASGQRKDWSINIFKHVKTIEKINFARNLGAMLQAGLALSRALSVLERQTHNKAFRDILTGIIADINKGTALADALSKYPKVFAPLFIAMVHAGEQSGTLAESLKVVATQMDSTYALDRRIRGSLMYPAVILFAMILIVVLMFIFVIPTLLETFIELNVELPLTTRIVIWVSDQFQVNGILIFGALAALLASFIWWSRRESGKKVIHSLILKVPIIGPLVQEVNTARTARTLSSLLSAGVDVVESISITSSVVQNVYFKRVLDKAGAAIKGGELMSKIFNDYTKYYPIFFAEMMSVGEETGKTGEMLLGVAHYYEEDVDQKTKNMSTVIEPFLILAIGAAVGFFAVSMIQPMYSLVDAI